jgi:hypothetical protein
VEVAEWTCQPEKTSNSLGLTGKRTPSSRTRSLLRTITLWTQQVPLKLQIRTKNCEHTEKENELFFEDHVKNPIATEPVYATSDDPKTLQEFFARHRSLDNLETLF